MMVVLMTLALSNTFLQPEPFMETFLWIRDKRDQVIPFQLNVIQKRTLEIRRDTIRKGRPRRWIILKARRQGQTTLWEALNFKTVSTKPNTRCVTLAQENDASEQIFQIADLFWKKMPSRFRPKRLTEHDKRDLEFPALNSMYYIGTIGKKGFGRGSGISRYQVTELPHAPGSRSDHDNLMAGLDEAAQEGEGVLESTPNGVGDLFHETYVEAKEGANDWTPIFFRWFDDPLYRIPLSEHQVRDLVAGYTDEEKAFVAQHNLTPEQIAWRRFAQRKRKRLFKQEFPEDDVTCFLLSSHCFFDQQKLLIAKLKAPKAPIESLYPDESGTPMLRIWKYAEPGHRYAIGSDVAEGVPTGDFSVAHVLDVDSLEHVASLRGRLKPEDFARRSATLGEKYNRARIAGERNNHGHSYLNTLWNTLEYPNLYWHSEYDAKTGSTSQVVGWNTSPKSRPIMLDRFRDAFEDGEMPLWDPILIGEMSTFVKQKTESKRVTYAAEDGCHDDTVIAGAIALQCRDQVLGTTPEVPEGSPAITLVPALFPNTFGGGLH